MGGIFLEQALPVDDLHYADPFLLIHHWNQTLRGGNDQKELGVGPHPHRGFSPVTFIFEGAVHHRDSQGNDSVIKAGGTQWMHAGSGIVHSERPTKELAKTGGNFELIQFWINDPASQKMTPPHYYPLTKERTPVYVSPDKKSLVQVVAGEFMGVKGSIPALIPLKILRFEFKERAILEIEIESDFTVLIYQLDGSLRINNKHLSKGKNLIAFEQQDGNITIQALKQTRAIFLSGSPSHEPVVTYGPIVMNTSAEIRQALNDARLGKMGTLQE